MFFTDNFLILLQLGTLFCAEYPFMDKLKIFVWSDHATKNEFEYGCKEVVDEFELSDNSWLEDIYVLMALWVPAFFNDEQMVGLIRTT